MAKNVIKLLFRKDLILFLIIGFLMTGVNFLLLALFVEVFSINYIIANVVSYVIAVIISYFLNSIFAFERKIVNIKDEFKKIFLFSVMKLIVLLLDTVCLYILVQKFNINLYVSKLFLTIIFTLLSFTITKVIINGKN